MKYRNGEYEIDTDKRRLDIAGIHRFLTTESYWAKTRTLEQTLAAIENSTCFGLYHAREQVGFARVVSDRATFAYIGDVYILEAHRGKALSKWMISWSREAAYPVGSDANVELRMSARRRP